MDVSPTGATRHRRQVAPWCIYLFGALGAILWGYDTGVISGALLYIKREFAVSSAEQGLITASITIGAAIGALLSALLAKRAGRKRLLFVSSVLFVAGTLLSALAPGVPQLLIGRVLLGVAIGFVAVNVPVYLAEIAPPGIRGRAITLTHIMSAGGILLAYILNYAFSGDGAWRWMIGIAVLPAVLLLGGIPFLPESPRWLIGRGRLGQARSVLQAQDPETDAQTTIDEVRESLATSRGAWRSMLKPWARRPVTVSILMTVLAQFLGINAITYYAPTVLTAMGFSDSASLITTVGFGAVSFLATLLAARLIEPIGRKRLLAAGATVTGGTMLILAVLSWSAGLTAPATGLLAVVCFTLFKAGFSTTWGPVSRVVETEILPVSIRGAAVSVAEVANFAALFLVSLLFPVLLEGGAGFAFFVFTVMGAVAFLVALFLVPEMKGQSLETIERGIRNQTAEATDREDSHIQP